MEQSRYPIYLPAGSVHIVKPLCLVGVLVLVQAAYHIQTQTRHASRTEATEQFPKLITTTIDHFYNEMGNTNRNRLPKNQCFLVGKQAVYVQMLNTTGNWWVTAAKAGCKQADQTRLFLETVGTSEYNKFSKIKI